MRLFAIVGVVVGFTIAARVMFGWSCFVGARHPHATLEAWGASYAPITGWLSAAAVAVAFVAMYLQTHELRAQQTIMGDQLREAEEHRKEGERQRIATEALATATRDATHVAALAAEINAVRNVALACQGRDELEARNPKDNMITVAKNVTSTPVRGVTAVSKAWEAIEAGDRAALDEAFAPIIDCHTIPQLKLVCVQLLGAHVAVRESREALELVRSERQRTRA